MDIVSDILQRFWIMLCLFRDREIVRMYVCAYVCTCAYVSDVYVYAHPCMHMCVHAWTYVCSSWITDGSSLSCVVFSSSELLKSEGLGAQFLVLFCALCIFSSLVIALSLMNVDTIHILTTPKFIIQSWFVSWSLFFYIQQLYTLYLFLDVW